MSNKLLSTAICASGLFIGSQVFADKLGDGVKPIYNGFNDSLHGLVYTKVDTDRDCLVLTEGTYNGEKWTFSSEHNICPHDIFKDADSGDYFMITSDGEILKMNKISPDNRYPTIYITKEQKKPSTQPPKILPEGIIMVNTETEEAQFNVSPYFQTIAQVRADVLTASRNTNHPSCTTNLLANNKKICKGDVILVEQQGGGMSPVKYLYITDRFEVHDMGGHMQAFSYLTGTANFTADEANSKLDSPAHTIEHYDPSTAI